MNASLLRPAVTQEVGRGISSSVPSIPSIAPPTRSAAWVHEVGELRTLP